MASVIGLEAWKLRSGILLTQIGNFGGLSMHLRKYQPITSC